MKPTVEELNKAIESCEVQSARPEFWCGTLGSTKVDLIATFRLALRGLEADHQIEVHLEARNTERQLVAEDFNDLRTQLSESAQVNEFLAADCRKLAAELSARGDEVLALRELAQEMWDYLDKAGTVPGLMRLFSTKIDDTAPLAATLRQEIENEALERAALYFEKFTSLEANITAREIRTLKKG